MGRTRLSSPVWRGAAVLPLVLLWCANVAISLPAQEDPEEPAQELFAAALKFYDKGKYAEARRAFAKVVERFPDSSAASAAKRRTRPSGFLGWTDILRSGDSANRVDVVIMGEGYTLDKQRAFDKLAANVPKFILRQKTLAEYEAYFNFIRANVVSAEDGVDGFGREYDTALGGKTLSTYAGHVGIENGLVREVLTDVPGNDGQAIVFVRLGVLGTGGGGVATIGGQSVKTVVHEFGHSFFGLGDEYTSETHKRGKVRNAVNVSNTPDESEVSWAHWIEAEVPGIGVYEGAAGQARDAWKPTPGGCVMDTGEFFCFPCREEAILDIYRLVDPIETCEPEAHPRGATTALELAGDALVFRVQVMEPSTHALEVEWHLVPEALAPQGPVASGRSGRSGRFGRSRGTRAARGHLAELQGEPLLEGANPKRGGWHTFTLKGRDLAPGRYRLICRARDTTRVRGDRWPWVLKDTDGVLESERAWWVDVAP
ncbi:MAG TPA: hypothetical protein EYQ74_02745 [Planctomycetes bacterium]|nr:hypothetical protein [Planctomycetota bacterium]HIK60918.1 hypothetical protein [Planctomycetota bacterium]